MIPKEAIEKAIEGGWEAFGHCSPTCPEPATFEVSVDGIYVIFHEDNSVVEHAIDNVGYPAERIVLDASFWKSLGKALGWEELTEQGNPSGTGWYYRASAFLDLVLTGGDTDAFWKELLK